MKKSFYFSYCPNIYSYLLTPNGDGLNDTFEIDLQEQEKKQQQIYRNSKAIPVFNLTIFNKNGMLVYQKDSYMQDKERFCGVGNVGSFAGSELPDGDYFFRITGSEKISGNIYIKRK